MYNSLSYRLSLGLTILLSVAAFITLIAWPGQLINGAGKLPAIQLVPWTPLLLVALAGINCSLRARLILGRHSTNKASE